MQVAAPAAGSIQSHSGGRQREEEGAEQGLQAVAWSTHGGRPATGQTDRQGEGEAFGLATEAEHPTKCFQSTRCTLLDIDNVFT